MTVDVRARLEAWGRVIPEARKAFIAGRLYPSELVELTKEPLEAQYAALVRILLSPIGRPDEVARRQAGDAFAAGYAAACAGGLSVGDQRRLRERRDAWIAIAYPEPADS